MAAGQRPSRVEVKLMPGMGEEAPRFFPLGAQQVAEKEIVETWRTTRASAEMRLIMACSPQR